MKILFISKPLQYYIKLELNAAKLLGIHANMHRMEIGLNLQQAC